MHVQKNYIKEYYYCSNDKVQGRPTKHVPFLDMARHDNTHTHTRAMIFINFCINCRVLGCVKADICNNNSHTMPPSSTTSPPRLLSPNPVYTHVVIDRSTHYPPPYLLFHSTTDILNACGFFSRGFIMRTKVSKVRFSINQVKSVGESL